MQEAMCCHGAVHAMCCGYSDRCVCVPLRILGEEEDSRAGGQDTGGQETSSPRHLAEIPTHQERGYTHNTCNLHIHDVLAIKSK